MCVTVRGGPQPGLPGHSWESSSLAVGGSCRGLMGVPAVFPIRTVRASQGPVYKGVCKCFCRSKGHGFITPADGGPDIFLHISDVEGEYVPVEGDEVTYKMCSIPPKNEKLQAVEVVITHLAPGTKHETWSGHVISS